MFFTKSEVFAQSIISSSRHHNILKKSFHRNNSDWKQHAPGVAALIDRVNNLPNIKKWIESRPETSM